jgi:hypothetical protein
MRNLFLLLVFMTTLTASAEGESIKEIRDVLKFVETENKPTAVGDQGRSFGVLQIQWVAIQDVNDKFGTQYTHEDAFNVACAEEIFELYLDIWTRNLERREGRKATTEDIVRIWNGGPTGYKRDTTLKYFRKYLRYRKYRNLC